MGIAVLIAAMILIYVSHKHTKEPLAKHGYITIPSYFLFYSLLVAVVLLGVFFDLAIGKRQRW